MDELDRRYAQLVAGLVDRVDLDQVAARADRLVAEAPSVRLRVLARSAGATARALTGDVPDVEAIVDAPLPVPDADATIARLDDLLPGPEPLPARIGAFHAATRLPDDALEPAATRLLHLLRGRAHEDLELPDRESVSLRVTSARGQHWSVRPEPRGAETFLALNASAMWTPDRLVSALAREAYPGRHLARLVRGEEPPRWEPSPATTVERGRDAIGREVLLADHELAHELELMGRSIGARWDGALICRVRRALDERAAAIAGAALDSRRRDVLPDLRVLGIEEGLARDWVARWRDPLAPVAEAARAAGPPLVRVWLETTGQTAGLQRLLGEPLVPTELRAEIGEGNEAG